MLISAPLLRSAHRLKMVITCVNLFIILNTFQWFNSYGVDTKVLWTDRCTDGPADEGHSYNPLSALLKGINLCLS
jgi:hypothetical protein